VNCLSEDKKKKMYYYYGGKEKKASEIKKANDELAPLDFQSEFDRMMDNFQREFRYLWGTPPARWHRETRLRPSGAMMPSMDLEDRGKDYRLTVDLPGFNKENVDIQVNDDSIVVNAKKTMEEEEKNKNYIRRERAAQTFYRRIPLPEKVQSDNAKASLNNGSLEVILPKKEPKETKKLKIE
jgi:HSP20 family protein